MRPVAGTVVYVTVSTNPSSEAHADEAPARGTRETGEALTGGIVGSRRPSGVCRAPLGRLKGDGTPTNHARAPESAAGRLSGVSQASPAA